MTEQEIIAHIKELENKIRHTRSNKLKSLYRIDIVALNEFLEIKYGKTINNDMFVSKSFIEKGYSDLDYYDYKLLCDFISIDNNTRKLANTVIKQYDKSEFIPYESPVSPKYDIEYLEDLLIAFLDKTGNKSLDKYIEILENGITLDDDPEYAGYCCNFFGLDKQVINISSSLCHNSNTVSEVAFFETLAHEMGHAVHMSTVNKSIKNIPYATPFAEGISMLYEKMFLDFISKNNIDISSNLRNNYTDFLYNACIARAGSRALRKDDLVLGYIIPSKYFNDKYIEKYSYVFEDLGDFPYDFRLLYFYGELMAQKIIDEFGDDYKNAAKEMLEILMKAETVSPQTIIDDVGLDKVPKGVARTLKNIK